MIDNPPCEDKSTDFLLARSPEPFPKLTLFPEGWDLNVWKPEEKVDTPPHKKNGKLPTFPNTTDSWI